MISGGGCERDQAEWMETKGLEREGSEGASGYIHTGIFQGKIKNFPGLETPPVRSSDPTVQYSVGPMVRSYTRHVPILRKFFI